MVGQEDSPLSILVMGRERAMLHGTAACRAERDA
jgi:hypothetical protein